MKRLLIVILLVCLLSNLLLNPITAQDTEPPFSYVEKIIPQWWNKPVRIYAYAHDNESGVASVSLYYRYFNNSTWTNWKIYATDNDASNGWSWTFTFPDGIGFYEFYSIAVDNAGNVESPPPSADASAGYDIFSPSIVDIEANLVDLQTINISCCIVDDLSGVKTAKVKIDCPNGTTLNLTMKRTGCMFYLNRSYTTIGNYSFKIFAHDHAGNKARSDTYFFTISNLTHPYTQCILNPSSPNGKNGWYISNVKVTLKAYSPFGISYTKYRIDGGSWINYTEPFAITSDGEHLLEYYSVDNKGNVEDIKSTTIKIDKSPPSALIIQPEGGYLYIFNRKIFPTAYTIVIGGIIVKVIAYDAHSDMENVSFYVNGVLREVDGISPYEWFWKGEIGYRFLKAIAYNRAGLSTETQEIFLYIFSL